MKLSKSNLPSYGDRRDMFIRWSSGVHFGRGYSFLSRSYGLGVDSVRSLTIVTADGEVRTISAESKEASYRELFWACLGRWWW